MVDTTVQQYLEQWLSDYCETRLAENTIRGYRVNIRNHIIPHIGGVELLQLQPGDVQKMYAALLGSGLSTTSVLYVHAVIRRAFNCAVRQRLLTDNVIYCVYPPRRTRYRGEILNGSDLVKLVAACEGTDIYVPVLLGASLGLRRGEILGLKWSDLDFHANTLHVQRTATFYKDVGICLSEPKTQTSCRTLLVSNYVMCRLADQREHQAFYNPLNLVCCRAAGVPLTSSNLDKLFKAALERAGLPRIRFHDLRHPYVNPTLKSIF